MVGYSGSIILEVIALLGMLFSIIGIVTCREDEKGKPLGIIGFIVSAIMCILYMRNYAYYLETISMVNNIGLVGIIACTAGIIKKRKSPFLVALLIVSVILYCYM